MLGMRMQQEGDRRVTVARMAVATLKPAFRAVDDDIRHRRPAVWASTLKTE
jgi:hypothetical protein